MLISAIILLLLVLAALWGSKIGLVKVVMMTGGYLVLLVAATILTPPLASCYRLVFSINSILFANGLAVGTIFLVGAILLSMALKGVSWVVKLPVLSQVNAILGAGLAAVVTLSVLYFVIITLANFPNTAVQSSINDAPLAQIIVKYAPNELAKVIHKNEN